MHRLTITLPDDLYAMARAYAVTHRKSISKAIGELLRKHNPPPPQPSQPISSDFQIDPDTQLPVVKGKSNTLGMEDVQHSIDDEDARHLEMFGLNETQQQPNTTP